MNSAYRRMPCFALEVEAHLHVNAAVAEVSVERRLIVVFVEQLAQVAQIRPQLLGRDRRIVPAFPPWERSGNGRRGARTRLADLPDGLGLGRVVDPRQTAHREAATASRPAARQMHGSLQDRSIRIQRAEFHGPPGSSSRFGAPLCFRPSMMPPSKPSSPIGDDSRIAGT